VDLRASRFLVFADEKLSGRLAKMGLEPAMPSVTKRSIVPVPQAAGNGGYLREGDGRIRRIALKNPSADESG
jgi:hypothetical protein